MSLTHTVRSRVNPNIYVGNKQRHRTLLYFESQPTATTYWQVTPNDGGKVWDLIIQYIKIGKGG